MFHEPLIDLWPRLSEIELRLQATYSAGEPNSDQRTEYWLSNLLTAYANAHRRKGDPPLKPKELVPAWGWEHQSGAKERESMKESTDQLLAWCQAMSAKKSKKGKGK